MSLPAAILSGGLGTRLYPLTQAAPKSLVDIGGRPFVAHQLELLRRNGIERAVLCVGHLGEMVEAAIGDGAALGIDVRYSYDGPAALGTAGALKKALPLLSDAFFVLYGDSYLDVDYQAVARTFESCGKLGLMTVFRNAGRWDRSNVLFVDGAIVSYDKQHPSPEMQHIDYGLNILRASVLDEVRADESCDLAELFAKLVRRKQIAAYEVTQRFYEIGSPVGLEETRQYLAAKK